MARELPTFKGYTVDIRLHQFRKIAPGKSMEFIDFFSEEDDELLAEYIDSLDRDTEEGRRIFDDISRIF